MIYGNLSLFPIVCKLIEPLMMTQRLPLLQTLLALAFVYFGQAELRAQVPQAIVVEHTTNTVCGICSFRNPPFYANLAEHPEVLHLSIHPSSPYSSCVLNQYNVSDNDDRAVYYGVYGGTPQFLVNGVYTLAADMADATVFDPYEGQMTPISLQIRQTKHGMDSIRVSIIAKVEGSHSLGNLRLYTALAEDTIFYNAPNGEDEHYDVLREALSPSDGEELTLPAMVGDSVVYSYLTTPDSDWNLDRIFTITILQDEATKAVVQAAAVDASEQWTAPMDSTTTPPDTTGNPSTGLISLAQSGVSLIPNPVSDQLRIQADEALEGVYSLYTISGQKLLDGTLSNAVTSLDLSALEAGTYLLQLDATLRDGTRIIGQERVVVLR